jgi:hypothetical protein
MAGTERHALAERLAAEYLCRHRNATDQHGRIDLWQICDALGIEVREDHGRSESFSGRIQSGPEGESITLSEAQYFRRRFTLAHELGHSAIAAEHSRDVAARRLQEVGGPRLESECDAFASALLFPADRAEMLAEFDEPIVPSTVLAVSRLYAISWSGVAIRVSRFGRSVTYLRLSPVDQAGDMYWVSAAVGPSLSFRRWVRPQLRRIDVEGLSESADTEVQLRLCVGRSGFEAELCGYALRSGGHLHVVIDRRTAEPSQIRALNRLDRSAVELERDLRSGARDVATRAASTGTIA